MPSPRTPQFCLEELEGRTVPSASLIKDINPGAASSYPGARASYRVAEATVNGVLFFSANDLVHGAELWKSDGTEAGTVLVKDLFPGTGSSYIQQMANVSGTLFFRASDGVSGTELWKSDGTTAGTVLVKSGPSVNSFYGPKYMTNVNGTLFFTAHGQEGGELWKSDGTDAGTVLVKRVNPTGFSNTRYLTNVNGTLFFRATDGDHGYELWKSDGTTGGTAMVKDIYPGFGSAYPGTLMNVNGTLLFSANDGTNGVELWKSDGTTAGTMMVKDINPGFRISSTPFLLQNVSGTMFFSAQDTSGQYQLWKSDGTTAGTVLVKAITPGLATSANVNGEFFFQAQVGLWKSDGTDAGTVEVAPVGAAELTNVGGTLFFRSFDFVNGEELWQSDGTAAGTVVAADIAAGGADSHPNLLVNVNGKLFFNADDGSHGEELWIATAPDKTGAQITNAAFTGTATGTFDKVTLTFSEAMQDTTLNTTNITLTGPGGAIAITVIASAPGSNTQFQVLFPTQSTLGDYTLNAAVGVLDLAGNQLNQNGVAPNGQVGTPPTGDQFTVTRTLGASTGPRIVALGQSDGSIRILDGGTNEVLVASFRPLDANGQRYKSTVAVAIGDVDGDGIDELFVGAQKRAGVAGLDASKAGKVFVYNMATAIDSGSVTPVDTITPFAKNFDGTQTYETGFELATGDVNGDGTIDLIAGSRGDVGQISVMSGVGTNTNHTRLGSIVTPFGTNYRGKVLVAGGNFIAETGTQNDEVAAARGNTDSTDSSRTGTTTRVAMFDLVGSSLNPVTFSGAIAADGTPSEIAGSAGQVIDRNAFVASIDLGGTGPDLLLFAARDFVSDPNNAQIRVAVYGVSANGSANLQSSDANGDGGSYLVGNQVGSYAIARSDIDNDGADSLAMVVDGPSAGVLYLAPLTGASLGGLTTPILTGGVRLASD